MMLRAAITGLAVIWLLSDPVHQAWAQEIPAWRLVWSDEFDQLDGAPPNTTKWSYDVGGHGWGNGELQYHTYDRRKNARIEDGCLVIEAHKETYQAGSKTWNYTSARLKTQAKASWTYGRFEARMKLPRGQGLWPAFWMLGANFTSVGWPACGEIDIMENIGREPATVHGSAHGPGYSGSDRKSRSYSLYDRTHFADQFHLFAVEWEPGVVRWSVDNKVYFTLTPASLASDQAWVFDTPFFLIVNLAVGGHWPGAPDRSTVFPQRLAVDHVRVYTRTTAPAPALLIQADAGQTLVSWPATFPQARLQQAAFLGSSWEDIPIGGVIENGRLVNPVASGVFRLR